MTAARACHTIAFKQESQRRALRAERHCARRGDVLTWDFLQRYDESWIWRCAEGHEARESSRNFAALDECMEDAVRHGYVPSHARVTKAKPIRSRRAGSR